MSSTTGKYTCEKTAKAYGISLSYCTAHHFPNLVLWRLPECHPLCIWAKIFCFTWQIPIFMPFHSMSHIYCKIAFIPQEMCSNLSFDPPLLISPLATPPINLILLQHLAISSVFLHQSLAGLCFPTHVSTVMPPHPTLFPSLQHHEQTTRQTQSPYVGICNFKLMLEDSQTFGLLICHDTLIYLGTLVEYSRYIL